MKAPITPIRKKSTATERKGVRYLRTIVEDENCVFREIDRVDDYGHDAFVHIVDGESVTPVEIALQIKSGLSFCRENELFFSASLAQLTFWAEYKLLTLGVVYDPKENCAWWINLTDAAKEKIRPDETNTINIPRALWNRFDAYSFKNILIPLLLNETPRLDLGSAIRWSYSEDPDTHQLGIEVLLDRHLKMAEAWEAILSVFRNRGKASSFEVIRGMIRIMGHSDEGYFSNEVPWYIRTHFQNEILNFGKKEFVDLLSFSDGDIERGSVIWGLLSIIPPHARGVELLEEITMDTTLDMEIRENAKNMLWYHQDDPYFWNLWKPSRPHPLTSPIK